MPERSAVPQPCKVLLGVRALQIADSGVPGLLHVRVGRLCLIRTNLSRLTVDRGMSNNDFLTCARIE